MRWLSIDLFYDYRKVQLMSTTKNDRGKEKHITSKTETHSKPV